MQEFRSVFEDLCSLTDRHNAYLRHPDKEEPVKRKRNDKGVHPPKPTKAAKSDTADHSNVSTQKAEKHDADEEPIQKKKSLRVV